MDALWSDMLEKQPIVSQMMINSITKSRISHAYLFHGDKGTGKYEMAQLFAMSIFCQQRSTIEPCQQCSDCRRIKSGNHPDLHIIIPDGASIKKDQILHLQKEFTYTGLESNKKMYIISQAEKMTDNASNRLLKFLEEPSKQTTAILLTENSHSVLSTIRSRCQMMAFKPLNPNQLRESLQEEGLTEANARLMTSITNNLTEAMEKSKDTWFAQSRKLVVQLIEMLQQNQDEVPIFVHTQWMPHFTERVQLQEGLDLLMLWFRDMVQIHLDEPSAIVYTNHQEKLEAASIHWSLEHATENLQHIMTAKRKLESNVHPQLVLEQLTLHIQR
ncbi:DNA polymerase III subunit delta' [Gracilibacillus caseinilyticus]|uniref:DNA polymerase III subunit delta' n=1 Tax=Gracilibacillus caseinilyticus TaxID=2932256 RepID=A0ABY4F502_9BACI|nr:DNA polymerase III subunit delta' [Gracilibacillus caseinilyticus]UOQ49541.1 DNA polymerase III subunit delta' [Gracilibacillus caseinilyticus]